MVKVFSKLFEFVVLSLLLALTEICQYVFFQEFFIKEVLYGYLHNEESSYRLEYVNQIIHKCIKWLLTLVFINLFGLGVSVTHYCTCANKSVLIVTAKQ